MVGRRTAVAVALMVMLVSGCATSGGPPQPGEPPACPPDSITEPPPPIANRPRAVHASYPPNYPELNATADVIGELGRTQFRSVFAGLAINTDEDRVDVWAKKSPEFTAEINALPGAAKVRMHEAPYSYSELEPTLYRIAEDYEYWVTRGLDVVTAGARIEGTYIEVGTPDPARARQEFPQRYPGTPFCFYTKTEHLVPFGRG